MECNRITVYERVKKVTYYKDIVLIELDNGLMVETELKMFLPINGWIKVIGMGIYNYQNEVIHCRHCEHSIPVQKRMFRIRGETIVLEKKDVSDARIAISGIVMTAPLYRKNITRFTVMEGKEAFRVVSEKTNAWKDSLYINKEDVVQIEGKISAINVKSEMICSKCKETIIFDEQEGEILSQKVQIYFPQLLVKW